MKDETKKIPPDEPAIEPSVLPTQGDLKPAAEDTAPGIASEGDNIISSDF